MDQKCITDALDEDILSDDDFSSSDLDADIVMESEHDTCTEENSITRHTLLSAKEYFVYCITFIVKWLPQIQAGHDSFKNNYQ
ncbi:hypothetical protein QTP88_000660 [Uroleucon formosanum]